MILPFGKTSLDVINETLTNFHRLMDNHKKIFLEILEGLKVPELSKTSLLEKIYEINLKPYGEETRHYIVEFIVEERSKAALESDIKKFKRKLISSLKKKLFCESIKFEIVGRETYELNLDVFRRLKEKNKRLIDQKEMELCQKRLEDQIDLEELAKRSNWQDKIKKNKEIKEGYIYILSNLWLPGTYKIGFVKDDPENRAKQLKSETGFKTAFVIEKIWWTKNPYEVEQKIFNSLQMKKNEKDEYYGKSYRTIKQINGKSFTEFVDGASLKFFCERIEEFIQK